MPPEEIQDDQLLETDNNPQLPAGSAFQRRGFAAPADEAEEQLTDDGADRELAMTGDEEEPNESEEVPAPKTPDKIKIGDRTFDTQEDAFSYARELENEKLTAQAFREGVELAERRGNPNPAPATAVPEEDFDQQFYADPKKYLQTAREQIRQEIKQEVFGELDRKRKHEETWETFYKENPDLSNARKLVGTILSENWEQWKHLKTEVGMKKLAESARTEKRAMLEDMLPKTDLPNRRVTASPGSGSAPVTRKINEDRPLSFTEQIKQNRAKRVNLT